MFYVLGFYKEAHRNNSMNFSAVISEELKLEEWRVAKALELMEQGGTVPFIARYRKDQTGTLTKLNFAILLIVVNTYKKLKNVENYS
jgi:transcriptional accessory protein Tex/SPT6